jgi:hypothetical protein
MSSMAKKKIGASKPRKLRPGQKSVWLVLPEEDHNILRIAAAIKGIPMSEYAKLAVTEAAKRDSKR